MLRENMKKCICGEDMHIFGGDPISPDTRTAIVAVCYTCDAIVREEHNKTIYESIRDFNFAHWPATVRG